MSHADVTFRNHIPFHSGFPFLEKWLLRQVMKAVGPAPIRFAIGDEISPPCAGSVATVEVRDLRTLAALMVDPEIAFGEGYADGRIEVHGDLAAALTAVYEAWPQGQADHRWYQHWTSQWAAWRQQNSLDGSRDNIHRHYDLGNDFYELWLDPQLLYSCAYFPTPSATLEEAQEAKLEHICRKLHLQPGERVVEAGCGWGALALYMARHYGVRVKAFNISHEQIRYARQRAAEERLNDRVEFVEEDCRRIEGSFDAFVSVGMLEHIGRDDYRRLGDVIYRCIGDNGRGLLHFIGRSYQGDFSRWIRKRIFPGAYAPTLAEAMGVLEPHRYSATDVENLRLHYAKTIEHWMERFEKAAPQVRSMYGQWFERAWRLYLAGALAGFRADTLQLFQISFAGSKHTTIPWTRAALYTPRS